MAIMILLASSQHNLCLKMETEPASEMLCFFNKLDNGRWEGGEIVLANFNQALFSLLSAHCILAMQALLWLHMVQFRVIQSGAAQFGAS